MTKRLGVAMIGLGMASLPHARALLALGDRIDVLHAFSPSADRRSAFAEAHGLPVTGTVEAIFDDPRVEAVLVLTPPNTHLDIVARPAAAGKHVLLKKPLEVTTERAEQLVNIADAAGITLGVVLQNRFRPAARELKNMIGNGLLGNLVHVSARTAYWRPQSYYDEPGRGTLARDGGGVLLTQAIHNVDLMISLVGMPHTAAGFIATSPLHVMEGEDIAAAILRFDNGAIGSITATTCAFPGQADVIDIIGDKGSALLNGTHLTVRLHDGTHRDFEGADTGSGSGSDPMAFSSQAHQDLINDFAEAIISGRKPAASGRELLAVHRLISTIIQTKGVAQGL